MLLSRSYQDSVRTPLARRDLVGRRTRSGVWKAMEHRQLSLRPTRRPSGHLGNVDREQGRKPMTRLALCCGVLLTWALFTSPAATEIICSPAQCKLCSAIDPGNVRDTIAVPRTWVPGACQNFARTVGAKAYQLGCMNDELVFWGSVKSIGEAPDRPGCWRR